MVSPIFGFNECSSRFALTFSLSFHTLPCALGIFLFLVDIHIHFFRVLHQFPLHISLPSVDSYLIPSWSYTGALDTFLSLVAIHICSFRIPPLCPQHIFIHSGDSYHIPLKPYLIALYFSPYKRFKFILLGSYPSIHSTFLSQWRIIPIPLGSYLSVLSTFSLQWQFILIPLESYLDAFGTFLS